MTPYQQRVVDEKTELDAKLSKLYAFLSGEASKELDEERLGLLTAQSEIMLQYSDILRRRIAAF